MVCEERRVIGLDHGELQLQPFGIVEEQAAVAPLRFDSGRAEPAGPEVQRGFRAHAPDHAIGHSRARAAATGAWILEERQVGAGRALLVRVEQVVDGRVVLVDGLLDEPQAE